MNDRLLSALPPSVQRAILGAGLVLALALAWLNTPALAQEEVPIAIPSAHIQAARGQLWGYNLNLQLRPGDNLVAVAVRDEVGREVSVLTQPVPVAGKEAGKNGGKKGRKAKKGRTRSPGRLP